VSFGRDLNFCADAGSAGTKTWSWLVVVFWKISHTKVSHFFWKDQRQHMVSSNPVFGKQKIGKVDEAVMERAEDRFI